MTTIIERAFRELTMYENIWIAAEVMFAAEPGLFALLVLLLACSRDFSLTMTF
jgi:hypothetical protein